MTEPDVDYVLPLRWQDDSELADLTAYLREISRYARVLVVDGSPADLFDSHARAWAGLVTHLRPEPIGYLNGKVNGVRTGLQHAQAERVVIADDDVRYDAQSLHRTVDLLGEADLVGPQNVFVPMPWHAVWDTARTLLNRSVAADYPGTFAIRRSTFVQMGGYDGDVLFENLELMRTVRAFGGRVVRPLGLYVPRRPADAGRFLDQRVRQAYDDLAQPWRMATYLPVVPLLLSGWRGRRVVAAALGSSVALAEVGRRRAGGRDVFPVTASIAAPVWVLERAVCSWVALGQRVLLGGVRYSGQRLAVAAHSPWTLRKRLRTLVTGRGPEAGDLVGPVAERLARGPAAAAQRDGVAAGVDRAAGPVEDHEAAADEKRSVLVRPDHGAIAAVVDLAVTHADLTARQRRAETVSRD